MEYVTPRTHRKRLEHDLWNIVLSLDGKCNLYYNHAPDHIESYLIVVCAIAPDRVESLYNKNAIIFGRLTWICGPDRTVYSYSTRKDLYLNIVTLDFYEGVKHWWKGTWVCIAEAL